MHDARARSVPDAVTTPAPQRDAALRALAGATLCLTVVIGAGLLLGGLGIPAEDAARLNSSLAVSLLAVGMIGLGLAGAVLARQRPRSRMAWLLLVTALAWVIGSGSIVAAWWLLEHSLPLATAAGWLTNWIWIPAHALSMLVLLRLPTGRLPSSRWRVAEWGVLGWAGLTVLVTALLPGALGAELLEPLTNPLGWPLLADVGGTILGGLFIVMPALVLISAAAPVVRWRRAGSRERAALRWVAAAAALVAVAAPLAVVGETGEILQGVAGLLLPIGIGTSVLREELWDLDLRRRYDRLRRAREQERERLRRELHDSLGPLLGSISMRAEAARNLLGAGETARIDDLLSSIGEATDGALTEVRRLIDDLGPAALHDHDLVPALRIQLAAYTERFPVTLEHRPVPLPPLEERAAATAYLVISEAVRNAARHSGGTGVAVDLAVVGDRLRGEVRDDGHGIGSRPAGVGRTGMARRIAEEGGRLSIEATETGGTRVRFELPGAVR